MTEEQQSLINLAETFNRLPLQFKMSINFLNPFVDYEAGLNLPEGAVCSAPNQVMNTTVDVPYKWFNFGHFIGPEARIFQPEDPQKYEVGWWSVDVSDEQGNFETPVIFTIDLTPQPVFALNLIGDSTSQVWARDFNIRLYNALDVVVETVEIRENQQVNFVKTFTQDNIAKYEVEILSMNKPYEHFRLIEISTTFIKYYSTSDIVSVDILEELQYDETLPIGAISANEVEILLDNMNLEVNLATNSPYQTLLSKNRRVNFSFGLTKEDGTIHWIPYGTYYTTADWKVDEVARTLSLRALDTLELLRLSDYVEPRIFRNATLYDLVKGILDDYDMMKIEYDIDTALQEIILPYAWFPKMSHRAALTRLATLSAINIFMGRDNKIYVKACTSFNILDYIYRRDTSIIDIKHPNKLNASTNTVRANVYYYQIEPAKEIYQAWEKLVIPKGETIRLQVVYEQIPAEAVSLGGISNSDLVYTLTASNDSAEIVFTNPTNADITIENWHLTGDVLTKKTTSRVEAVDNASKILLGEIAVELPDNELRQGTTNTQVFCEQVRRMVAASNMNVELETRGNVLNGLNDRVYLEEISAEQAYKIQRLQTRYDGSYSVSAALMKI